MTDQVWPAEWDDNEWRSLRQVGNWFLSVERMRRNGVPVNEWRITAECRVRGNFKLTLSDKRRSVHTAQARADELMEQGSHSVAVDWRTLAEEAAVLLDEAVAEIGLAGNVPEWQAKFNSLRDTIAAP